MPVHSILCVAAHYGVAEYVAVREAEGYSAGDDFRFCVRCV